MSRTVETDRTNMTKYVSIYIYIFYASMELREKERLKERQRKAIRPTLRFDMGPSIRNVIRSVICVK